jgi:hypothetical protein
MSIPTLKIEVVPDYFSFEDVIPPLAYAGSSFR